MRRPSRRADPVDVAGGVVGHVKLAGLVFAEGRYLARRVGKEGVLPGSAAFPQPPDPAAAQITV